MVSLRRHARDWRLYAAAGIATGVLLSHPALSDVVQGNDAHRATSDQGHAATGQRPSPPSASPPISKDKAADKGAHPADLTSEQKPKAAKDDDSFWNGKFTDWAIVFLTGGLLIVGGLQAYIYWRQAALMRQALRATVKSNIVARRAAAAAKLSADVASKALTDLERPYVFIYGIRGVVARAQDGFKPRLTYCVSNNGRLAARVTDVSTRFGLMHEDRFPPVVIQGNHALLQKSIISPDEERDDLFFSLANSPLAERTGEMTALTEGYQLPVNVIFQVCITYDGPITKGHESAHCWRYRRNPNGWVEIEDTAYTYMK